MPMYNLIEYNQNYIKTSISLWQYHNDVSSNPLANSKPFTFKVKITERTSTDGNIKDVE